MHAHICGGLCVSPLFVSVSLSFSVCPCFCLSRCRLVLRISDFTFWIQGLRGSLHSASTLVLGSNKLQSSRLHAKRRTHNVALLVLQLTEDLCFSRASIHSVPSIWNVLSCNSLLHLCQTNFYSKLLPQEGHLSPSGESEPCCWLSQDSALLMMVLARS